MTTAYTREKNPRLPDNYPAHLDRVLTAKRPPRRIRTALCALVLLAVVAAIWIIL